MKVRRLAKRHAGRCYSRQARITAGVRWLEIALSETMRDLLYRAPPACGPRSDEGWDLLHGLLEDTWERRV